LSKFRTFFSILLCLILLSTLSFAQEITGKIIGKVTDDQGAPLPGVTVEATCPTVIGKITALSASDGTYRLLACPAGMYTIEYTLSGFSKVVREYIELRVEQTLTLDINMTPGTIEEAITVTGESPLVDVKSTTRGMTINKAMFETLPRGRNFDTLVTAIPGVNVEPGLGGISVDGASGSENMFYVDGTEITNIRTGLRAQDAAFEFVEEIQVKASGYTAEYGGSMGGVVNVITRSGGNEFHGEVIGYYSGSWLTGKERDSLQIDFYDITKAEYVNYQDLYGKDKVDRLEAGFNLSGYIIRDSLWFFGSFLPVFRNTERHVVWEEEGYAPSNHTQKWNYWNAALKLTAQPIKNLRLSAGFINNWSKVRGSLPSREGTSSPTRAWGDYGFDYPNWSASFSAHYTVGNDFLISARAGMFHKNQGNQGIQPTTPQWRFSAPLPNSGAVTNAMFPEIPDSHVKPRNWYNISTSDLYVYTKDIEDRQTANLDFTYYAEFAGEHALKAGVQYVRLFKDLDSSAKYERILLGWDRDFIFMDTAERVRGTYGFYGVDGAVEKPDHPARPYGNFGSASSIRWAIFLQDSWTPDILERRLTLNLGVRLEKEDMPHFYDDPEYELKAPPVQFNFTEKIAPRIGFIYDVFGDANLKIFGSYGMYYDVMKLDSALSRYGARRWYTVYYTLDDWDFYKIGNGNYPGTYIHSYNHRTGGYENTEPDMKPISQYEFTFGVERQLFENVSGSVRVVYKHLLETIEDVGILNPEIGEVYMQSNPGRGITLRQSEGGRFDDRYFPCPEPRRDYWGVNVNVDKRFSNNWLGGISYTWSRLWGNYGGLASSDEWGRATPNREGYYDQWWLNYDKNGKEILGLLNTDRAHQFKVYGSYIFDFGLTVGVVANGLSGTVVSRELDVGNWSGYYPDQRATDGRTPFLFFTDLYAEYTLKMTDRYRIQFNVNVDNLFDTATAQRLYTQMNQGSLRLTDDQRLNPWDYSYENLTLTTFDKTYDMVKDPRFLQGFDFYPPIQVRLGVKFIF
jgi:hypothetical protein